MAKKLDLLKDNIIDGNEPIGLGNLSKIRIDRENESMENYYAITLDGRVIKTMYKDDLFIPSKALAIALAEEWDAQLHTIDLRAMHLNNMVAKGVRSVHDESLNVYMLKEANKIFEND